MTLTEILSAVSSFVTDFGVYIASGLVVGIATYAVSRLIRSGR